MLNLDTARKNAGITLTAASNSMGMSRDTLRKWETTFHCSPLHKIERLAQLYGVNPMEFFMASFNSNDRDN